MGGWWNIRVLNFTVSYKSTFLPSSILFKFEYGELVPGVVYEFILMSSYRDLEFNSLCLDENVTPFRLYFCLF
jgi:hypothetical protein